MINSTGGVNVTVIIMLPSREETILYIALERISVLAEVYAGRRERCVGDDIEETTTTNYPQECFLSLYGFVFGRSERSVGKP